MLPLRGLGGRVVMQRTATPLTPVRFRPQPPFLLPPLSAAPILGAVWCPDTSQPKSRGLNRHTNLSAHFAQREISPITRKGYFLGLSPPRSEGQAARRYWVMDHRVITAAK